MKMKMYDALGYINNGLGFKDNQLFDYIIWTSSEEGIFLKTQSVTRQEPLKDKSVDCKWLMLALKTPIDSVSLNYGLNKTLSTELRVYFLKSAKEIQQYKEITERLGYPYVYTCLTDWRGYKEKNNNMSKS